MSFDALLTIVFILLFVVGPLVRRLGGGGRQQRPPTGRPAPDRPTQAAPAEEEGPLARRLEEARRRVQEAMSEREPPRRTPEEAARPTGRRLDWQPAPVQVPSFIPAQRPPIRKRSPTTEPGASALPSERRPTDRQAAKLPVGRKPALNRDGIVNGVIWHEILSEPVSRRGIRRQTSRLRSR
jgi:hypothetical protein